MKKISFLLFIISLSVTISAQDKKQFVNSNKFIDSILFSKVKYRLVGPFRGGRSGAVSGDYRQKILFILAQQVAVFGKQLMAEVTGKISLTNILVDPLVQLQLLPVMQMLFMWEKEKIQCVVMLVKA